MIGWRASWEGGLKGWLGVTPSPPGSGLWGGCTVGQQRGTISASVLAFLNPAATGKQAPLPAALRCFVAAIWCAYPTTAICRANPATWMLDVTTPAVEAATGGDFAEHFGALALRLLFVRLCAATAACRCMYSVVLFPQPSILQRY